MAHARGHEDITALDKEVVCPVLALDGGDDPVFPLHVVATDAMPRPAHATCVKAAGVERFLIFDASGDVRALSGPPQPGDNPG